MKLLLIALIASTLCTAQRPTLWLIGDSTVHNGKGDGSNGQWGWGEPLVELFDGAKIHVLNKALGGRSSRTYWTEGQWKKVSEQLKAGDWVMVQFGHNDSSPINDDSRARGTIKGIGEETEEIENLLTKKHEVVHSFGWYMRLFIREAQQKGAKPIVCSPVPRMNWTDGKIQRGEGSYAGWARAIAAEAKVPFVDLAGMIADRYDELGPAAVEALFKTDHTHTSRTGAELNAKIALEGLRKIAEDPFAGLLVTTSHQ